MRPAHKAGRLFTCFCTLISLSSTATSLQRVAFFLFRPLVPLAVFCVSEKQFSCHFVCLHCVSIGLPAGLQRKNSCPTLPDSVTSGWVIKLLNLDDLNVFFLLLLHEQIKCICFQLITLTDFFVLLSRHFNNVACTML